MSIARDAAVDYADVVDPDAEPLGPIHPGVILEEEFLEPLGLSAYALARAIAVPRNRITGILAWAADGLRPRDHARLDRRPARTRSDPARGLTCFSSDQT